MKLIVILMISFSTQVFSKQWIDPHDMNTNSKHYLKESSHTENSKKAEDCNANHIGESNSLIYLKRVINLFLNSANMDRSDTEYNGHLQFNFNDEDFQFLRGFRNMQNVNINDLRKLDTILSRGLKFSYVDCASGVFFTTQEKLLQLVFSENCLPLLAFCVFLYIAYNLFKSNFSVWYVFRYFLFVVVIIDFVQRYQYLYKEAEEHNMHLKYSLKCDTKKMSWSEYFTFLTSNEDCEKKVVSLLEVGLNQMKNVIIIPLSAVGTGMGQFGSELWKNLPFPWNILIFPIMLIFCAILVAIVMTTLNNTIFKFNLMHLLHLEFGDKKPGITGSTLDKLLDAVSHRPMLQEVKWSKDRKPPNKKYPPKKIENKKEPVKKNEKPVDKNKKNERKNQSDNQNRSNVKEVTDVVKKNLKDESHAGNKD